MLRARCDTRAVRLFIHGRPPLGMHADRLLSRVGILRNSFHSSSRCLVDRAVKSQKDVGQSLQQQKYHNLLHSLDRNHLDPDRVWKDYVDLLDFAVADAIPLQLHQLVLRKCSPGSKMIRTSSVQNVGLWLVNPSHPHEMRFKTVIRQIQAMGCTPTLNDYHVILEQFAAVGDCNNTMELLQEIIDAGVEPRTKTYGLCLQAIMFRLCLPCRSDYEVELRETCASWLAQILDVIRSRNGMIPSACLDMALRIIKDTDQTTTFVSLLRDGYGIDVRYLDRPPPDLDVETETISPFSTSTLTTIIDFFGRQGDISKMVQAFEVFTAKPIKTSAEPNRNVFEDDDDDAAYPSELPSNLVPSARPNIATYNSVIRHCAQHMRRTLAMHYFSQVLELDTLWSRRLRDEILTKPVSAMDVPEVQVNKDTFVAVRGLAIRFNDVALMKQLLRLLRQTRQRKKAEMGFFAAEADKVCDGDSGGDYAGISEESGLNHNRTLQDNFSEASSPDLGASQFSTSAWLESLWKRHELSLLASRSRKQISISFDISFHITRLRREVYEMKNLERDIGDRVYVMSIQEKERMGRRVWKGETVYLKDRQKRTFIDREKWKAIVNFNGHNPRQISNSLLPSSSLVDAAASS